MQWFGMLLYFLSCSDSSSYVSDTTASSGLSRPPILQRFYWAVLEAFIAAILIMNAPYNFGEDAGGMRALSICMSAPIRLLLCVCMVAIYRLLKFEFGEEDILRAKKFNTQVREMW